MPRVSNFVQNIVPSMTGVLKSKLTEMKRSGISVIAMSSGEPDFITPINIIEAAKKALDDGHTKYTPHPGILTLRQAICDTLLKENHVEYNPEQICAATGAKQALINTILSLCNPGDEVLLPTPAWFTYFEQIKMSGAVPIAIPLPKETGYQLDINLISKAVSEKTKAIILCSPNNPTGAIFKKDDLKELAALAEKNNFFIISDEIYKRLIYDEGEGFTSISSLSSYAYDHTIVINGFSKAYAMTGWRLGYAAGPKDIIKGMISIMGHTTSGPNSIAQWAGVEALNGPQESVEKMRQEFDRRRKYVISRLNSMKDVICPPIHGAFYAFPDVCKYFGKSFEEHKINNSLDFCNYMLEQGRIAIIPGSSFGADEAVRITFACSMEDIVEGLNRMENTLALLK